MEGGREADSAPVNKHITGKAPVAVSATEEECCSMGSDGVREGLFRFGDRRDLSSR